MTTLKVGDEAPVFEARDCEGAGFSLASYRGKKKVVLFFFPRAFTVRCEEEVRNFREHYARIVAAGGELVGVSTDKFGSFIEQRDGVVYFGHDGKNDGFLTIARATQDGEGVVVMSNGAAAAPLMLELIGAIARTYGWRGWK